MRRSIQRRLIVLSAVSGVALVSLVSALVWWRMSRVLRADFDRSLETEARALAGRLQDDEGRVQLDLESRTLADAGLAGDVLVQVRTAADGNRLFEHGEFGPIPESLLASHDAAAPIWFDVEPAAGRPYRAIALYAAVPPDLDDAWSDTRAGEVQVWTLVARPLAPLNQTLTELALTLGGAAFATMLLGGLISRSVAAGGIRPIRAVAAVIERAAPGDEQLKISEQQVPSELDPIVAKTNDLLGRIRAELDRQRRLTADIAHDLRTPVAGVRTLLDVALQRPRTAPEYEETLLAGQAALRQLSLLLDDVLVMARLDAGLERPHPGDFTAEEILAAAVESVRPLAMARGIAIETDGAAGLRLFSDRAKLVKILTNLMSNAVEHSPTGAAVRVTAGETTTGVEFRVRDPGPGIPAELRERVFDRFYRAADARPGDGHHGLGLPIARHLARLLGGEVRLNGEVSPGSEFCVTLPAGMQAERPPRTFERASAGCGWSADSEVLIS